MFNKIINIEQLESKQTRFFKWLITIEPLFDIARAKTFLKRKSNVITGWFSQWR